MTPTAPEVADGLPGARLQGSGRLSVFGLHVYDIRLWVGEGFSAEAGTAAAASQPSSARRDIPWPVRVGFIDAAA